MKWFKAKEFVCKCCGELPSLPKGNIEALVRNVLDPARERLGQPIVVNSGYRCPKHNIAVGGAVNSQHIRGEAADICCADNLMLLDIIREIHNFDQLIIYPTFLHVSYRRSGANRHQVLRKVTNGYRRAAV